MAGKIRVPGGFALGTFIALALGVSLWWILDTLFPGIGTFVRGVPRTSVAPTTTAAGTVTV